MPKLGDTFANARGERELAMADRDARSALTRAIHAVSRVPIQIKMKAA